MSVKKPVGAVSACPLVQAATRGKAAAKDRLPVVLIPSHLS